ncbi:MAG: hypothetical protein OEY31_01190 [Candidatus Bathyarchaeota archaeon]|nr:hypothetical protein [Candidatus Bathyarchaeota archaeon]
MWKRRRKVEEKKVKKEESLLKELCRDDSELYDVLASLLYLDPIAAISRTDLEILIEETEKSVKDLGYEMARLKYRQVMDKALFEASQNPEERSRYIKVIKDLVSKIVSATEKAKEKVEKNGLTDKAASLERRIHNFIFISERIEDVINVASHFYNERLVILGEKGRREERREERREMGREEREEAELEEMRIVGREEAGRERRRKGRAEARSKEFE